MSPVTERPDLATGKVLSDLGAMMQQEAEKIDEVVAADALNQLAQRQLDLTYGDEGYTKIQGKGVVERPIMKEYPARINAFAEELAGKIGSTKARQKFQLAAADLNRSFAGKVAVHSANQIENMEATTFEGARKNAEALAANGDLDGAVKYMAPFLGAAVQRKGLTGEAAGGLTLEVMGGVYSKGIEHALSAGRTDDARTLFETYKGSMTSEQVDRYGKLIAKRTDFDAAAVIAKQAETMQREGVPASKIEDHITDQSKGRPEVYQMAQAQWTQRQQALVLEDSQAMSGALQKVLRAPTRATVSAIQNSVEYAGWPKSRQLMFDEGAQRLREHAENVAHSRQSWVFETPKALTRFLELRNDPQLPEMTPQQLAGFAGEIGNANVMRLQMEQDEIKRNARRTRIDPKIIEGFLPEDIRGAGPHKQTQRAVFNAFFAQEERDWKEANPGKLIGEEATAAIAQAALKKYVEVPWYKPGKDLRGFELRLMTPQQRSAIEEALRRNGREVTPDNVMALWASRPESKK